MQVDTILAHNGHIPNMRYAISWRPSCHMKWRDFQWVETLWFRPRHTSHFVSQSQTQGNFDVRLPASLTVEWHDTVDTDAYNTRASWPA
jgi:hypothetical protein